MPDHEHTPRELGELVRDVMTEKGVDVDTAVEEVHAKIANNGLHEWWSGVGRWAIKLAEREMLRSPMGPTRRERAPRNPHAAGPRSWRDRYMSDPNLVFELEVAIGKSGERKRIGDLTKPDVYAIKEFYVGAANTMLFRGEYWGRMGDAMQDDDTIQGAFEQGRIRKAHLDFLAERGRVDGEPDKLTA